MLSDRRLQPKLCLLLHFDVFAVDPTLDHFAYKISIIPLLNVTELLLGSRI